MAMNASHSSHGTRPAPCQLLGHMLATLLVQALRYYTSRVPSLPAIQDPHMSACACMSVCWCGSAQRIPRTLGQACAEMTLGAKTSLHHESNSDTEPPDMSYPAHHLVIKYVNSAL